MLSSAGINGRRNQNAMRYAPLFVAVVNVQGVLVNGFVVSRASTFVTTTAWPVSGATVVYSVVPAVGAVTLMATSTGGTFLNESAAVETLIGPWCASTFLATEAWGRRPLLLRRSFDPEPLPTWDELVPLACNPVRLCPSRLITHVPGRLDSFEVDFGPFNEDDLIERMDGTVDGRPRRASTLVMNDVDRWIPDVSDWMDAHFSFLPRWRRDDAQVSLAQTGGGIGNHVDNYDVFLIQTSGSREWEIAPHYLLSVKDEYDNLVPGSELRILNVTSSGSLERLPTVRLLLEAGDCLYLPPRIMHCGTASSDDCITLSVGCRAPSAADLIVRLSEAIISGSSPAAMKRYTDGFTLTGLPPPSSADHILQRGLSSTVKEAMKELVIGAVQEALDDDASFDQLVGSLVTEPNRPTMDYPRPLHPMDETWKQELGIWANATETLQAVVSGASGGGCCLRRAEGVSFAWSSGFSSRPLAHSDGGGNLADEAFFRLYTQGRVFEVYETRPDHHVMICNLLDRIANGQPLDQEAIADEAIADLGIVLTSSNISNFLVELIEEGFLYGDGPLLDDDLW